jgi:hypothetical protein
LEQARNWRKRAFFLLFFFLSSSAILGLEAQNPLFSSGKRAFAIDLTSLNSSCMVEIGTEKRLTRASLDGQFSEGFSSLSPD